MGKFHVALKRMTFFASSWLAWFSFAASAIDVQLMTPLPDEVSNNLKTFLRQIKQPSPCIESESYVSLISRKSEEALQALGYYQSRLVELNPITDSDGCKDWQLDIELGDPAVITELSVLLTGDGANDKALTEKVAAFPLAIGDALHHGKYESGKSSITDSAFILGYFNIKNPTKRLIVNLEDNTVHIELIFNTGPRFKFGELLGKMSPSTRNLVASLVPYKTDSVYHAEKLAEFNKRLTESGYFRQVVARPNLKLAKDNTVPIEVILVEKARDAIEVGGGVSSDTGPRVRFQWERARVNDAGHSLNFESFVSSPEQTLTARYRIPLDDPANNFISLQTGLKAIDNNDTDSQAFTLAVRRHWLSEDAPWQKVAFVRLDIEEFTQADQEQQKTTLLMPGFTISRLRQRGNLFPDWGDRQILTVEAGSEALGSDIDLVRLMGQTRWLRRYGKHQFYVRAELAALDTSSFDEVPSSLRFFAGGDQSVRGFGYQTLSPENETGELIGGKYLYSGSIEYAYPLSDSWYASWFVDAGNASNSLFDNFARSTGPGIIWASPVGPVRFYLARGKYQDERTWRIHFAMGANL